MATLIVDIETVGEEWQTLDPLTQDSLLRWVMRSGGTEAEQHARIRDVKEGLGFSPFTGFVVALGVYDVERKLGTVYYHDTNTSVPDDRVEAFFYRVRSEAAMLAEFWDGVRHYDTVVTYNGRQFDIPFILARSAIQEVVPTVSLLRQRYLSRQTPPYHIDLQDELTWYGAMHRRPNLHTACRAFGITSPKEGGVAGDDVAALFYAKKCRDIATYNTRDLLATALLYEKWRTYLAPPPFHQSAHEIDF